MQTAVSESSVAPWDVQRLEPASAMAVVGAARVETRSWADDWAERITVAGLTYAICGVALIEGVFICATSTIIIEPICTHIYFACCAWAAVGMGIIAATVVIPYARCRLVRRRTRSADHCPAPTVATPSPDHPKYPSAMQAVCTAGPVRRSSKKRRARARRVLAVAVTPPPSYSSSSPSSSSSAAGTASLGTPFWPAKDTTTGPPAAHGEDHMPQRACPICCAMEADAALKPCHHVVCARCAHVMQRCPMCRGVVVAYNRLYFN